MKHSQVREFQKQAIVPPQTQRDRILPKLTQLKASLECDYCAIATQGVEYEANSSE